MKILFFSDAHLHNHQQHSTRLANGLNSRLMDCVNIVYQAEDICRKRNLDACIFLGDYFHSRTRIDTDVFVMGFRAAQELARSTKLFMLVGNHCQSSKVGEIYSTEPFREFCTVVDKPTLLQVAGASFYAVPYFADVQALREVLKSMPPVDVLLMHQPLAEALPGATNTRSKSLVGLEDIPFDRVRFVLSGDIHRRCSMADGKFVYLGSPLPLTQGERDEEKGFSILDTASWSLEFVPAEYPKFHWITSEYDPCGIDFSGMDLDRDFIRVSYLPKWKESVEMLKEKLPRVQWEMLRENQPLLEKQVDSEIVGSDPLLLEQYITQVGYGELDKTILLQRGLEELMGHELGAEQ